jgi:hypothetical protein
MATQEKILERVRNMLARADHPNTPEAERELCYERAQILMTKHAIDEARLRAEQPENKRRKPVAYPISMDFSGNMEFLTKLQWMLVYIAEANRCRCVYDTYNKATLYGFQDDVDWVETLFTNCFYGFVSKINPRWNPTLGYDENVYNTKVAGWKWIEINAAARRNGGPDAEIYDEWGRRTGKMRSTLISAYRRHARLVGDDNPVTTQSFKAYRVSFGEGFLETLRQRLRKMKDVNDSVVSEMGAELVFVGDMDSVLQRMYADHPDLSPEARQAAADAARESARLAQEARDRMLSEMTDKQRRDFLAKEDRERARDEARWQRQYEQRRSLYEPSGERAGRAAAEKISLDRPGTGVRTEAATKKIGE